MPSLDSHDSDEDHDDDVPGSLECVNNIAETAQRAKYGFRLSETDSDTEVDLSNDACSETSWYSPSQGSVLQKLSKADKTHISHGKHANQQIKTNQVRDYS